MCGTPWSSKHTEKQGLRGNAPSVTNAKALQPGRAPSPQTPLGRASFLPVPGALSETVRAMSTSKRSESTREAAEFVGAYCPLSRLLLPCPGGMR